MTSLTEDTDVPNWVVTSVATAAMTLSLAVVASTKIKSHEDRLLLRERQLLYTSATGFVIAVMGVTLAMGQGTIVRDDTIESTYARWGYLIGANILFAFKISDYVGFKQSTSMIAGGSMGLASTAFLLASLSTGGRIWFYYAVGVALHFVFAFCLVKYPLMDARHTESGVVYSPVGNMLRKIPGLWIIKGLAVLLLVSYGLFFGLGKSCGFVISFLAETWVYAGIDIVRLVLLVTIDFWWVPGIEEESKMT
jgi:hypothetical protein